jgi:hypothetical protein
MPAKAGIHDFKKGKQSKRFFFEKKKQKTSLNGGSSNSAAMPTSPAHLHARKQMFLRPDLAPVCRRAPMLSGMTAGHRRSRREASLTTSRTAASRRQVGGDEQR